MLQYFETLQDQSGNALAGATVTVTAYPAGGAVTIYSTNGTAAPIAGSVVTADVTGQVQWFAPDGAYILTYANNATVYKTKSPVQFLDPMAFVVATDTSVTVNVVTVTNSAYPANLITGMKIRVAVANSNTGAVTFNLNSTGAIAVTYPGGGALGAGALQANGIYDISYDGTRWQLLVGNIASLNPLVAPAATIGPPATAVPALVVVGQNGAIAMTVQGGFSAPTFPSASFNGSAQFYGLSVSRSNQNVTLSQIYLHGGSSEMVTINGAAGTDAKVWSSFADASGVYHLLRLENDALTGINECVTFTRTGFASQVMTWYASYGPAAVFSTPALGGTYLLATTSPNTASASYGIKIQAGTNSTDLALAIVNAANTANLLQVVGDGEIKMGAGVATGVTCLQVAGVASSAAPCATFGGAASNFITVTDGAGLVTVVQSSTGVGGVIGTSSNNPLTINTNNAIRAVVGAAGGITVVNGLSCYNVTPPTQVTGFGTPTGTGVINNFPGATATLAQCSQAIAQLITDVKRFGLYAA